MGTAAAISQAINDMWYPEVSSFPSSSYGQANPSGDFESYGHWSQLVWVGSTQIGCYTQLCQAGTIYDSMDAYLSVCNYYPAGMCTHLPPIL